MDSLAGHEEYGIFPPFIRIAVFDGQPVSILGGISGSGTTNYLEMSTMEMHGMSNFDVGACAPWRYIDEFQDFLGVDLEDFISGHTSHFKLMTIDGPTGTVGIEGVGTGGTGVDCLGRVEPLEGR